MSSSPAEDSSITEESKLEELFQSKLKVGSLKIKGYRRTNVSFLHSLIAPSLNGENFREVRCITSGDYEIMKKL